MLTEALFIVARTRKQTKCPSTEEWIKTMWYVYTMEYYSAIKKNEIMSFTVTRLDQETVILSEVILYFGTGFIYLYVRILSSSQWVEME